MSPVESRARALAEYARAGDPAALVRGALVIATLEHTDLDEAPVLAALEALGHEAARRLAGLRGLETRAAALSDYLATDLGFHGNEQRYDDPRNSFLNDVLTRRTGIPIALAVLYIDVGRRAGLTIEGVNFPGHFLVRVHPSPGEAQEPDLILDPFHAGAILRDADCRRLLAQHAGADAVLGAETLATADTHRILVRMLVNLKRLYVRGRSFPQALDATTLLGALEDEDHTELRDRGLLAYQMRRYPEALRDLEAYLRARARESSGQEDEDRQEYEQIWEHVKALRRRLASFN
jgi:regulator of sirC expression with transglutaminase-like and TPR domain